MTDSANFARQHAALLQIPFLLCLQAVGCRSQQSKADQGNRPLHIGLRKNIVNEAVGIVSLSLI
jgi:hypothetical protein